MKRHIMIFPRIVMLAVSLVLVACGASMKPGNQFMFAGGSKAERLSNLWFGGDEDETLKVGYSAKEDDAIFIEAEAAYWRGDLEYAFDRHAALLERAPGQVLTRYAAARLYTMRESVSDYAARARVMLDAIDYKRLLPATRLYVAMIEQHVAFEAWQQSDSMKPFAGGDVGFARRWAITPVLSEWRLRDIDTPFSPQESPTLRAEYLSPVVAVDSALNYQDTRPWEAIGLEVNPNLKQDGIYYMETFVTIPKAVSYWLNANFVGAARIWIDGEEVIRRDEGTYETGKRIREIELSAGTHRVLVKLAYQRGYRDWFDLNFVPAAAPAKDMGMTFRPPCLATRKVTDCHEGPADGTISLTSDVYRPSDLEPIMVMGDELRSSPDIALYLTMLSGYFGDEPAVFEAAWNTLRERQPDFAAGYALESSHIQTRWEIPARLRDPTSLAVLREAVERDPKSALFQHRLGAWLRDKGKDREIRETLELARDLAVTEGRLRMVAPLNAWATYLAGQGWDEAAELAWRDALVASATNCAAARRIQILEGAREIYRSPAEITPEFQKCPALMESYYATRSEFLPQRLRQYEKYAKRHPYRAGSQLNYAEELVRRGRLEDATLLVDEALKRTPSAMQLWNWKIDQTYAMHGKADALALLDELVRVNGNRAFVVWKRSAIEQEIPLKGLMSDGVKAAMDAVKAGEQASLSNDDAYFVIDFAARNYFPDGSSITLTHTVVRVMTKNAIDRYAESSIPSDSRVLTARTIKADGSVQEPEQMSGKSTLSMPGLAEGDFVELAYLQYSPARRPPTEVSGVRFFFRMTDISTLHSEYIILGLKTNFMLENNPPEMESITYEGVSGVRFLATNNPRPRAEPHSVPIDEYLPWVQMYRYGTTIEDFEASRRDRAEQIHDSLKKSPEFLSILKDWTKTTNEIPPASPELAERIFYTATRHIPDPSAGAFGTEVSHAALLKEGSAHLLLKAAYDQANIPAEIYLVRSAYAPKAATSVREFSRYVTPVIRIEFESGEVHWVSPDGPDAMYGAIANSVQGQPAICVTCTESVKDTVHSNVCPTTSPAKVSECKQVGALRHNTQYIDVGAEIDETGKLKGEIMITFDGANAVSFRRGLRSRTDETSRLKLAAAVAAGVVPGADVIGYEFVNEKETSLPLELKVVFERASFARKGPDGKSLVVETRIFHEAVAQLYATLPDRTIPILVSYPRFAANRFTIVFPRVPRLGGQPGVKTYESNYGRFVRSTEVDDTKVVISTEFDFPIQRIPVAEYKPFQAWAVQVEQSSPFFAVF